MITNAISQSMSKNLLGVYDATGDVIVKRTSELMEASYSELAQGLGLKVGDVRSTRLSGKAQLRLRELAEILDYVGETFEGNEEKTRFWMKTPNLEFGGASPRQLILRGKHQKVLQFVMEARQGK